LFAQNQSEGNIGDNKDAAESGIQWTEIPKVDRTDATIQRGIVFGPDGKPLAGANIYAASNIELFEIRSADEVTASDLGDVRAVTDDLGRFDFRTPDLTWTDPSGEQKRWEAFIVSIKDGLAPGWIKTFGDDRGLRSHWHPHVSKDVAIHMASPAKLSGRVVDPGGGPLLGAKVVLRSVNIPRERDLDKHIDRLRKHIPGMFSGGVGYQESVHRPWLIPGQKVETETDANGGFFFTGLPKDHIVSIEIAHPKIRTTRYTVAVREMQAAQKEVPAKEAGDKEHAAPDAKPRIVLRGSGGEFNPPAGVSLSGQVTVGLGLRNVPAPMGITVAMANHNAPDGMTGAKFQTDKNGRFQITGLGPDYNDPGYILAFVGSFHAPIESKRVTVHAGRKTQVKVRAAVPYRLKLTDQEGKPINRKVYSISVQRTPDLVVRSATDYFDVAVNVAPGVYEGIVPNGPGAVFVKRENRRDRPASVDPKSFFEPGRFDWTAAEQRYAYGDEWQITQPGVITTEGLAPYRNRKHSQLEMAAIILTKGVNKGKQPLELTATVHQDTPPEIELIDTSGQPVKGARIRRLLTKYNDKDLPAKFSLYGLHPSRAEFIQFIHDDRKLIGTLAATLTSKPHQVVMKSQSTLRGRIVDPQGKPTRGFTLHIQGSVPPHTFVSNHTRKTETVPKGSFSIIVAPDEVYSGHFMRLMHNSLYPRPLLGKAFGPVTPKPGEELDLGDLQVQ
jgi:hypothetical protein